MPVLFIAGLYIFLLSFLYSKGSSAQTTTIANGAIVTVSASTIATTPGDINIAAGVLKNKGSVRLQGSWANNGSFSDISGTVTFNATTRGKTISGSLTGANKFNNLVFNGTGGTWEFEDDAEVGASLSLTEGVVTAPPGILTLKGNVTQTGASFLHNTGLVQFSGSLAQSYTATTPLIFYNLTNNNTFGLPGVSINSDLVIENELQLKSLSKLNLVSGDIILRSTAANTANVASIPVETNIITYGTGRFIVERYINIGNAVGQHGKSWQLLAAPVIGQTIKQSWMEGAGPNANPNPGFGTQITGLGGPSNGFDATSPQPSMKFYEPVTDTWTGVGNPATTAINNKEGYFVFVRGDRSVINFSGANSSPLPTTLRIRGNIQVGSIPGPSVMAGLFQSVGNPYASSIDLRSLSLGSGINSTIIVWDPTIGGAHGLGAFQTLFLSGGNYANLLSSKAYGPAGTSHNFIQSGQAFIIQGLGAGGTLNFKESDKASGSSVLLFASPATSDISQLRTNLYSINEDGSPTLLDGTLIQYSKDYTNAINGMDARKMTNSSENLSIKSGEKYLVIERRQPIVQSDTIFYNLTGVGARPYQFEFIANGLDSNGPEGFVEDTYLRTRTPLKREGTTIVDFSVTNIAGSYAPGRFRIVFTPSAVVPVTFTSVKAYRQAKDINVEWRVENEVNMKQYEVEKSINGTQFTTMSIKPASANSGRSAIYFVTDANPVEGYNYYRVKSMDINSTIAYSPVVKVLMGSLRQDITISPNPVADGKIHLQLMNQPGGRYGIRLLNKPGQVILSKEINHAGGSSTELIKPDYNLAHGIYQLEVTNPDGSVKNINVLY